MLSTRQLALCQKIQGKIHAADYGLLSLIREAQAGNRAKTIAEKDLLDYHLSKALEAARELTASIPDGTYERTN